MWYSDKFDKAVKRLRAFSKLPPKKRVRMHKLITLQKYGKGSERLGRLPGLDIDPDTVSFEQLLQD